MSILGLRVLLAPWRVPGVSHPSSWSLASASGPAPLPAASLSSAALPHNCLGASCSFWPLSRTQQDSRAPQSSYSGFQLPETQIFTLVFLQGAFWKLLFGKSLSKLCDIFSEYILVLQIIDPVCLVLKEFKLRLRCG